MLSGAVLGEGFKIAANFAARVVAVLISGVVTTRVSEPIRKWIT